MLISINFRDPRPIYEQVKSGFRELIISGVLDHNTKMPSVRELASSLAINPNTIQRAYRELEQEGFICSVPGRGSFVCQSADAAQARRNELFSRFDELYAQMRTAGISPEEITQRMKGDVQP